MLKIADTQTVGTASYCLPMGPIGKETPQWDEVKFVLQRKKKKQSILLGNVQNICLNNYCFVQNQSCILGNRKRRMKGHLQEMIFGCLITAGFALNGVALYNAASARLEDAYFAEGETFDGCGAHAQEQGQYVNSPLLHCSVHAQSRGQNT